MMEIIKFVGFIAIFSCSLQQSLSAPGSDASSLASSPEAGAACTSPGCIHAAAQLLGSMDTNVNPCDDFYQFTCGRFVNKTLTGGNNDSITLSSILEQNLQKQLGITLEEPSPSSEIRPFKLVKNLYRSCMNTGAIETQSVKRLLEDLKRLGGWPVLEGDSWNETNFNWIQSIHRLSDLGYTYNHFLDLEILEHYDDCTKRAFYVGELPPNAFRTLKIMENNPNYMMDIVRILGADGDSTLEQLGNITDFERSLKEIIGEYAYYPTTIANLSKSYPSIPWEEFFSHFFPSAIQLDNYIQTNTDYITKLVKLMEETPKRVQANYLMWRVVENSLNYLGEQMREHHFQSQGIKKKRESRWSECVRLVSEKLPISVRAMYARKYLPGEAKKKATDMMDNIKKQVKRTVEKVDWMDEETRKIALEKLAAMTSLIGYPDEFANDNKLIEFYQDIELSDDNFLEGILNITLFNTKSLFSKLTEVINKTDWSVNGIITTAINAFYKYDENKIYFSAAMLQDPYFSNDRPNYINYGITGSGIAHVMSNGLDNQGRLFDKDGNSADWWVPSSAEKYFEKAQCFIDQYGNYSVEEVGMNLDGQFTLEENAADNFGYRQAYLAYKDWSARYGQEPRLPGLPYTPEQLFWISASNIYCEVKSNQALKYQVTNSDHSPFKFRILGSLSNIPEFSEDFQCKLGSKMNPVKKCMIW